MDLNKYTNTNKSELFHSSGQAQTAIGDSIAAAASNSTFAQRQLREAAGRQHIQSYRASQIGAQRSELRAKRFEAPAPQGSQSASAPTTRPQRTDSGPHHFVEPPSRNPSQFH